MAPFMGFMNKDMNYPIAGIPDTRISVSYRTDPKELMDKTIVPQ